MSENKWTPGPWRWISGLGASSFQLVGTLTIFRDVKLWNGSPADLDLIAAAPDMAAVLDAARIVLKNRDQSPEEMRLLDAIKIVLAKARGEAP